MQFSVGTPARVIVRRCFQADIHNVRLILARLRASRAFLFAAVLIACDAARHAASDSAESERLAASAISADP
jgi:hypothetical protein